MAFPWFDLPGELRIAVLEYLVVSPGMDDDVNTNLYAKAEAVLMVPVDMAPVIDLLLVCSQMYQEASAIFYDQNRFHLNLGSRKLLHQITQEGLFSPHGQARRRRIRNLSLIFRRMGGFFDKTIEPVVSDMVLCGNLRNLEIRFMPQNFGKMRMSSDQNVSWRASQPDAVDLVYTSPFQALLKLLADPDLDKAELWVWREHWSVWCPFHEVYEGDGLCGHKMKLCRKDWTQVDWKSMANAGGGQGRIVKVMGRY